MLPVVGSKRRGWKTSDAGQFVNLQDLTDRQRARADGTLPDECSVLRMRIDGCDVTCIAHPDHEHFSILHWNPLVHEARMVQNSPWEIDE